MRSMRLNLYTVKNKTSYLHVMKSLTGTDIFSHHQWGIKGCYTGVKARSWILIYLFFIIFNILHELVSNETQRLPTSTCSGGKALEVHFCSFHFKIIMWVFLKWGFGQDFSTGVLNLGPVLVRIENVVCESHKQQRPLFSGLQLKKIESHCICMNLMDIMCMRQIMNMTCPL